MIPVRVINYPFADNNLKDLTFRVIQERYAALKDEIIENKAIVVIDFLNDPEYSFRDTLENAPKELAERFEEMGKGDFTTKVNPED